MLPRDVDAADTLYVTDRDLNIVYANEEWDRFATDNRGQALLAPDWDGNVLANLTGSQRDRWAHIYRLLLAGRLPHHQEEMNCSSPTERRIYRLRVTPRTDATGEVAWLVHHNVRVEGKTDAVDRVERQLERIGERVHLQEEFTRRIAERRIRIPSYAVARHFAPLHEIGGDLVWHREYPDGITDVIHADVLGHGEAAGRVAAKMAIVLDELASVDLSPCDTVTALNRALTRVTPRNEVMFATGLCLRFEPGLQGVTCCNFGHEGPIFSRTGPIRIDGGCPVGIVEEDVGWRDVRIDLREHGTAFLVFSDGITEQFNADGAMFGVEGLHGAFLRYLDMPLDERVFGIIGELTKFRGAALVKDDQTLLALDFVGADAEGGGKPAQPH